MAGDAERFLIEQVAEALADAYLLEHGHGTIPWEARREKDRARWRVIAEAGVARWELGLMRMQGRRFEP